MQCILCRLRADYHREENSRKQRPAIKGPVLEVRQHACLPVLTATRTLTLHTTQMNQQLHEDPEYREDPLALEEDEGDLTNEQRDSGD
jgi:hypothetical protein